MEKVNSLDPITTPFTKVNSWKTKNAVKESSISKKNDTKAPLWMENSKAKEYFIMEMETFTEAGLKITRSTERENLCSRTTQSKHTKETSSKTDLRVKDK